MTLEAPGRRLFVPLAAEAWEWFHSGKKRWELRRHRGQFKESGLRLGRRVELRKGYRDPATALWGTLTAVRLGACVEDLLQSLDFREVIPTADNYADAVKQACNILGIDPRNRTEVIAFRVELD